MNMKEISYKLAALDRGEQMHITGNIYCGRDKSSRFWLTGPGLLREHMDFRAALVAIKKVMENS